MWQHRNTEGYQVSIASRIIVVVLCLMIPVNTLMIVSAQIYLKTAERLTETTCQNNMNLYMQKLDNQMNNLMEYLYTEERKNAFFLRVLDDKGDDSFWTGYNNVYRNFTDHLMLSGINGYLFLSAEQSGASFAASYSQGSVSANRAKDVFLNSVETGRTKQWKLLEFPDGLYAFRDNREGSVRIGCAIAVTPFLQEMEESMDFAEMDLRMLPAQDVADRTPDQWSGGYRSGRFIYTYARSQVAPFVLELKMDLSEVMKSLPITGWISIIMAFLFLLLIPALYYIFSRMIVRPLHTVDDALGHIEFGEQDFRIHEHFQSREFTHMGRAFNQMADQIMKLKIESYEKQIEKDQVEMQNIRLQVRPHFMLNLFHMIYSMAQIRNYEGIQEMSLYLSKYFRYMFTSGDKHTLEKEMEVVRGYLSVLEYQYPDCFEVEFDLDDLLDDTEIPTLLIHGIFENIGKYAIRVGNYVRIRVRTYEENGFVRIEVSDDGQGIEPEVLEQLQKDQPVIKQDGTHIGIWNARRRLKMLCGEAAELDIESRLSEGTKYTVKLPAGEEMEDHEFAAG